MHERDSGIDIVNYLLTKDMIYFSFYGGGEYDKKDILQIDMSDIPTKEYEIYWPTSNMPQKLTYTFNRKCATIFSLQFLCYITSKQPDIYESPATISSYRPSTKIKNKFSEIQQWEVGVRYGRTIRSEMQKIHEQKNQSDFPATEKLRTIIKGYSWIIKDFERRGAREWK